MYTMHHPHPSRSFSITQTHLPIKSSNPNYAMQVAPLRSCSLPPHHPRAGCPHDVSSMPISLTIDPVASVHRLSFFIADAMCMHLTRCLFDVSWIIISVSGKKIRPAYFRVTVYGFNNGDPILDMSVINSTYLKVSFF